MNNLRQTCDTTCDTTCDRARPRRASEVMSARFAEVVDPPAALDAEITGDWHTLPDAGRNLSFELRAARRPRPAFPLRFEIQDLRSQMRGIPG